MNGEDREALAEALDQHRDRYVMGEHRSWGTPHVLIGCVCGWCGTDMRVHRAEVVDAIARRRAAEELRALAASLLDRGGAVSGNLSLAWSFARNRADALEAE